MSVERGAFLHTAGLRAHVLRSGDGRNRQQGGPPTLLLHGLGSLGQDILAPLRDAAPGRFFVAPDRPGYGLSDPLDSNPGPIGQAHWLRFVVDAIGGGPPVIVAHSIAAGVALAFAALYPERLRGVLLIAPFCRPTRRALVLGPRLAALPLVGPLIRKTITARAGPTSAPAGELLAFSRDMALCRRRHRHFDAPVHVLCAPGDSILDLAWHVGWLTAWRPDCVMHFVRDGRLTLPQSILIAIRMLEAPVGGATAA